MPQSVAAGGSLRFTITADPGYHVADVLVDGLSVGARTSYEFTDVQADHTISASFAVDTGPTVTITSPSGGELWRRGSVQAIRWTLSAPVEGGRFTVWASSPSGELTQLTAPGAPVTALAGSTDYEWSYTVALPAMVTYQILVRYESDAGEVQSEARSAGRVAGHCAGAPQRDEAERRRDLAHGGRTRRSAGSSRSRSPPASFACGR